MRSVFRKAMCAAAAAALLAAVPDAEVFALTDINTSVPIQPGMHVAVVSKSTKGQYWSMVRQGMEAGVEAVNACYQLKKGDKITMTFEGPDREIKVEDQINMLDAVVAENPDVICLSAIDMESCQAQIESARENGIPVVVFDSNVLDTELISAFRATDNYEVGRQAAEQMSAALMEQGEVLIFSAQEKTESIQNRIAGISEILENCPEITVDEIIYEDQVESMADAMTEALAAYPMVRGVICTNADISELYLGLPAELKENILFAGVDATTKQQDAIKDGQQICTISQDPKTLGYETLITAVYAALKEDMPEIELEKEILLEPQKIDASNMYNPRYINYLYAEGK
ncbi:MAG: substrate-binding domain-containing protein [Clostridiales bacterium]|nr:substrate-binding domain-containing protein [Candidatus Blautia equi]